MFRSKLKFQMMWHTQSLMGPLNISIYILTVIAFIQEHHEALVHCGSTTRDAERPLVLRRLTIEWWWLLSEIRRVCRMISDQMRFVNARLVIELMDTSRMMGASGGDTLMRLQLKGHQLGCDVSRNWCEDGSGDRSWSMFLDEIRRRLLVGHHNSVGSYGFNALFIRDRSD